VTIENQVSSKGRMSQSLEIADLMKGGRWIGLLLLWVLMAHPLIHGWESHSHGAANLECPLCSGYDKPSALVPSVAQACVERPFPVFQVEAYEHTLPRRSRERSPPSPSSV
jgi:hypothetical protein